MTHRVFSGFVGLVSAGAGALTVIGSAPAEPIASAPATGGGITFVSPSPSEGATLAGGSVSFAFTYGKKPSQVRALTCGLSGPTASSAACDTPIATKTGLQSGKSYSGLANGTYTLSVLVTLTNGKTASATRHFTVRPAHAVTLAPATDEGGARVGTDVSYTEQLTNTGLDSDTYSLATSGTWTAQVYDATCTTPLATTTSVQPGASVALCVKVSVPDSAADSDTDATTVTATSTADSSVAATASLTSIAVSSDTLLVDEDTNNPVDSAPYYENALAANNIGYGYWDLATNPDLPLSFLTAHTNVVWFTGNAASDPIGPYESELATFLDGGGRLLMSGQDILDGTAGTAAFVQNYLHIAWDGSGTQNNRATTAVHSVSGDPATDGVGSIPLDHSVLNAAFEDEITPIDPATAAFTDDAAATDALTVASGAYKVMFLAFPFEAYGNAAQKSDLMNRAFTWFGS